VRKGFGHGMKFGARIGFEVFISLFLGLIFIGRDFIAEKAQSGLV
jgi:hypothetical protein